MTRMYVHVQLRAPPHHGPTSLVETFEADAQECAQRIAEHVAAIALDGTVANGGCAYITIQRAPIKVEPT